MSDDSASPYVPYVVEYENRPGYFFVHITSGNPDLRTSRKVVREAHEERVKSGHNKVLVLLDIHERMPFADIFWLASELPELGLLDRTLAVVDANPEHEPYERFAEAAANYFDFQRQGFASIEEAEQWLASI